MSRNGQTYIVCSRINNLQEIANLISKHVPDARVAIGHGQMNPEELEKIIEDLSNTKNRVILHNLNLYPILATKAHTRPFERKWLNIIAAIIASVLPQVTTISLLGSIVRPI